MFTENGFLKMGKTAPLLSWRLVLEEDGSGRTFFVEPDRRMQYSWQYAGKGYIAKWKGGAERRFFVEIRLEKYLCGYAGTFRYGGLSGKFRVKSLLFPLLLLPESLEKGEFFLPEPPGKRVEIPAEAEKIHWEKDLLAFPFVSLRRKTPGGGGVFLGAMPPKGCFLGMDLQRGEEGRTCLALKHAVSENPTARKKYQLPFACVFAPFEKEGEDLAYFRHFWEKGPLYRNRRKYKKCKFDLLWQYEGGLPLPELEKILSLFREKQYISGCLVKEDLNEEEKQIFARYGVSLIVRCNGMHGKGVLSPEEEERSVIRMENGENTPHSYWCLAPETPAYGKVKADARALAGKKEYAGVVYEDLFTAESNALCYASGHHHAPGGGSYRQESLLRLLARLHKDEPHFLLLAKGCSWECCGVLDGMILPPLSGNEGEDFAKLFAAVVPLYGEIRIGKGDLPAELSRLREKGIRPFLSAGLSGKNAFAFLQHLPVNDR